MSEQMIRLLFQVLNQQINSGQKRIQIPSELLGFVDAEVAAELKRLAKLAGVKIDGIR